MKHLKKPFRLLLSVFFVVATTFLCLLIYIYIFNRPISAKNTIFSKNVQGAKEVIIIPVDIGVPPNTGFLPDIPEPETPAAATSVTLPVAFVSQLPELPTGCEITSLTTVLNYVGFGVNKEYMAEHYLDKSERFIGNFHEYYIGNPWREDGWGCFSTVITKSANRYLADQNSHLKAYDISGASLSRLYQELDNNIPVIVWASSMMGTPSETSVIALEDGRTAEWYSNEHCLVLIGYDLDNQIITLSDPLKGIVTMDAGLFNARYEEFKQQAVIIK